MVGVIACQSYKVEWFPNDIFCDLKTRKANGGEKRYYEKSLGKMIVYPIFKALNFRSIQLEEAWPPIGMRKAEIKNFI